MCDNNNEKLKDSFGYIAGTLLVITLIPQIHQTYKTKKIDDLSIYFLIFQIITCIVFLVYGILLSEYPIILSNSVVLCELLSLLYAKFKFKNNKIYPSNIDIGINGYQNETNV